MKRPFIGIGLLLCTLVVLSPAVMAAHVHFLSGPTFTTSGGALTVSGRLAGLGNQDVTIVVSAAANVTCVNQGGNPPPGQRQTVSGTVSNLHPENGNLSFSVTTGSVSNPCPDHMAYTVDFTQATITVYQGGQIVFQHTYNNP